MSVLLATVTLAIVLGPLAVVWHHYENHDAFVEAPVLNSSSIAQTTLWMFQLPLLLPTTSGLGWPQPQSKSHP
ncbi:hypothetical protein BC830DRAFT_97639 [Chytriomyces sp. MP71]|nr:hypothetical protein BC830DRAFT_97639 [Chytriomyces sp. MP71]